MSDSQTTTEKETEIEPQSYNVPAPVAAALSSGRGLFVKMYAKELANGKLKAKPAELAEVLRLLGDLIEENYLLKAKQREFHELVTTQVTEKLAYVVSAAVHLQTDMREIVREYKPK